MLKILLVEDDRKVGSFLAMGLGEEGFLVTWAEDGNEGLREALGGDHHVILMDYMLPGRNGLEVVKELRRSGKHTPVLMLTAHDAPDDMRRGLEAGVDDFLVKPFRFDELLARVNRLVASSEKLT
ncbi:MAG TPA: response regulator [Gemmatimonadales bacterium]|nr:response regulator [Gemmatimonadales bacterium]